MESSLRGRDLTLGGLLVGAFGALVAGLALTLDDPPARRAALASSFFVLSLPPLLLAGPRWLAAARRGAGGRVGRWLFGGALLLAVVPERLISGAGPGELVRLACYVAVPLLLTADRPRTARPLPRDVLIVAVLWLPLELRLISGEFVLRRLLGLDLLLLLYVVERPVAEPGRLVPVRGRELAWGLGAWAAFLAVAIPLAMATGFAWPGLSERTAGGWALLVFLTFWVVALPEEALFRGAIQGQVERALKNPWWALVVASVVFGLSHCNNRTTIPPPDWRYVVLATLAGVAYGLAYLRTRNLAAPVLTHFLVDVTWRGFFAGLDA